MKKAIIAKFYKTLKLAKENLKSNHIIIQSKNGYLLVDKKQLKKLDN